MKYIDTTPKDPEAVLNRLATERQAILTRIENPLARLAVRAAGPLGFGPLAVNAWQTHYTKKKVQR